MGDEYDAIETVVTEQIRRDVSRLRSTWSDWEIRPVPPDWVPEPLERP